MNKFFNLVYYNLWVIIWIDAIHVALEYKINKSKSYAKHEELVLWQFQLQKIKEELVLLQKQQNVQQQQND